MPLHMPLAAPVIALVIVLAIPRSPLSHLSPRSFGLVDRVIEFTEGCAIRISACLLQLQCIATPTTDVDGAVVDQIP